MRDFDSVISVGNLWLSMQETGEITDLGGGAIINGADSPTAADITVNTGPRIWLPKAFDFDSLAAPTDLRINVTLPAAADWFISYWLNCNNTSPRQIGQKYTDNSNWEWSAGSGGTNIIATQSRSSGVVENPATFNQATNVWYHLSVSRTGQNYTQWLNGVLHSTGSILETPITATTMVIGNNNHIAGYVARFRGKLAGFYWRDSPGTIFDAYTLFRGPKRRFASNLLK